MRIENKWFLGVDLEKRPFLDGGGLVCQEGSLIKLSPATSSAISLKLIKLNLYVVL